MTIHEEIKDLVYYSDCSYEEAKKTFLNSFLGARMELARQLRLCHKIRIIENWKADKKRKARFDRLKKAIRGIL